MGGGGCLFHLQRVYSELNVVMLQLVVMMECFLVQYN